MYPYIDKGKNGTIPTDIRVGITKWMGSQNIPMYVGEVESTLLGTSSIAKSRINNSKPILVGLLSILGSTYGDHWVTAYAYTDSLYKVTDNWGDYRKAINISWTIGAVWINE